MTSHVSYAEQRRIQVEEAWQSYLIDPARDRIVSILNDWLMRALDQLPARIQAHELSSICIPDRIGDHLRSNGFFEQATALERVLSCTLGNEDLAPIRMGAALGEALAHVAEARMDEVAIRFSYWLLEPHDLIRKAYRDVLLTKADSDFALRLGLRRLLRNRVKAFEIEPQQVAFYAGSAPMSRWIEMMREQGNRLHKLWAGGLGKDVFRFYDILHFDILRQTDIRGFQALLCRIAIPGAVANLLDSMKWNEDLSDISALIARAPVVMLDRERRVIHGEFTILLLNVAAQKIQLRAKSLRGAVSSQILPAEAATAVETIIAGLAETVIRRPDGVEIAKLWTERLFWEDERSNVWNLPVLPVPTGSEKIGRSVIGTLVQSLVKQLPQPIDPEGELRAAADLEHWPCLLTLIAISVLGSRAPDAPSASTVLERLLKVDLVEMVGFDRFINSPHRLGFGLLRFVLLSEPDPVSWFYEIWRSKEIVLSRDRRWKSADPEDVYDGCNAALIVVAIGIAAVTPLGEAIDSQRALFKAVNDAVAGQVLAPTRRNPGQGWETARRACVGLWARLHIAEAAYMNSVSLEQLLLPFVRPTENFALDLLELIRANVSQRKINVSVCNLNHDLKCLLDIIIQDIIRRGDGSRIGQSELEVLKDLKDGLSKSGRSETSI